MEIAAATLSPEEGYKLMTGAIVPRLIAWITTRSPGGRVNAAPFSAFMLVCPKPPMVGIGFGRRAGELYDTPCHIFETREFVVNIADEALLGPLHQSAEEHPPEVSEVELLGLRTAPCRMISTPPSPTRRFPWNAGCTATTSSATRGRSSWWARW